jgi:hypothetical protein
MTAVSLSPGAPEQRPPPADTPSAEDSDGDRISITDVNGTIARFEMTYSPPGHGARTKFGPPVRARLPSALYLAAALVLGAVAFYAYMLAPSSSRLFGWFVEGDRGRPVPAKVLAAIVVVSALATVLRTHMRGVLVAEEWVEARYLLALGIPKAKRWGWPQVLRIIIDDTRIAFELWDGSFERLPEVAKARELVQLVMHEAQRRKIDVTLLERRATRS